MNSKQRMGNAISWRSEVHSHKNSPIASIRTINSKPRIMKTLSDNVCPT
jgi:hypothetical protein